MCSDPRGPEIIVGQQQFEFDGIAPLTQEQKLSSWIDSQSEETPDLLTAILFVADNESRRRRGRRWAEVRTIQAPFENESGWLVSGGHEVVWLYDEACRDYINGAFFSALLCAHSACERVLAGCLYAHREELPNNWLMWGLGKLLAEAFSRRLIDQPLREDLSKLNELRKVSAHFKPAHETTTSVYWRLVNSQENSPDWKDFGTAIDELVQKDAIFAIRIATILVRSNIYFGGTL